MMKQLIDMLLRGEDLTSDEACQLMDTIMSGEATDAQIGCVLTALRMKGETTDEIAAFASVMREKSASFAPSVEGLVTDTCGTGGAKLKIFNVSTAGAFVAAGAGVPIAKHGNRSNTSPSGSADVLEALGAKIDVPPARAKELLEEIGFTFLFAPLFHPAMKHAIGPRRELGARTVFNILGPLTNPAGAAAQVMGVFSESLVRQLAPVLERLGTKNALVVHGVDGLCELSTTGRTVVGEFRGESGIDYYEVVPEDFGIERARPDELAALEPSEGADLVRSILEGQSGPHRDIVLLNAAAAIYVAEEASSIREGVTRAAESIDSGSAGRKLEEYIEATNKGG